MSTETDMNPEDYVLVPRKKAKISRARRNIIGILVIGAVSALGGAGTFASFSASTTNDATFTTTRLVLKNTVAATTCISPAGLPETGSSGTANASVDSNDASGCKALFPDPIVAGSTATATVSLQNGGSNAGAIYLFAPSACSVAHNLATFDRGTATDLCDRVQMTVHNGTDCVFPAQSGACPTLADANINGTGFNDFPTFGSKITAISSLAANASQNVTVVVRMRMTKGAECTGLPSSDVDTGTIDGYGDSTGVGCDNKYQNQKASLSLRWLIQA